MPKFSAHLSHLFAELPFTDRFPAAAAAGFKGVDLPFPDLPMGQLGDLVSVNGLVPTLLCSPSDERQGIACLEGHEEEFRAGFQRVLQYADLLECQQVHVPAGVAPDRERKAARKTLLANLRYATREAKAWNVTVLIGALNDSDTPGSLLARPNQAVEIMEEVDEGNLSLLFDVYHAQRSQGGLSDFIESHIARIAHIQIAGTPGQHEPNVGEVHYPYLFDLLDAHGYDGWIGCRYHPQISTALGLKWARSWGIGG